jgi:hypothetical protein
VSFVITVYIPSGIVMASDSRQSIAIERKNPEGKVQEKFETISSDHVYKTFLLERQKVGINAYGDAILGEISLQTHLKYFVERSLGDGDDITIIPKKLVEFIRKDFPTANTQFHVCGYKVKDRISEPFVFHCHVGKDTIERKNITQKSKKLSYGASWGGQSDIISSVLKSGPGVPTAPVIWPAMNIQDAIDFAIYAVRTTIDTMRFQARPKNVGGHIDVLLITPDESPKWIQRKKYVGEPILH